MSENSERFVILTGGSRGLGAEFAAHLLKAGYRVATCSRKQNDEFMSTNAEAIDKGQLIWMPCELGVESQEEEFFAKSLEWGGKGRLYGLVNNAAIAGEGIFSTFPTVSIENILNINLLSPLRMSRLALRTMLTQRIPGRIVNITSIVGLRGYNGLAAYSASKAGLDAATRCLAREVGRRRITVNSIAPGYLKTELSGTLDEHQRDQIIRRTPMGKLGDVADIAGVLMYLLSEEASFTTGQVIVVDGGLIV